MPKELDGYPLLWLNSSYLNSAKFENGILKAGNASFKMLYIDVTYLPYETLSALLELAKSGLPVCLKNDPKEPGMKKHDDYSSKLSELKKLKNVSKDYKTVYASKPLIEGKNLPEYWIRKDAEDLYVFIANPKAKGLKYPIIYGQSFQKEDITSKIIINYNGKSSPIDLVFKPYQSLMLKIDKSGTVSFENIEFVPPTPDSEPALK